ncbi:13606_t:CDS:1, partial [Entrophospora sp. SA101]
MDPSLYQQQQTPQQNCVVPYNFIGTPQTGSTNVTGAGIYPQQYSNADDQNNAHLQAY